MCGRDSALYTWAQVHAFSQSIGLITPSDDPLPNYNRAPSNDAWVLIPDGSVLIAKQMRWGLVPAWSHSAKLGFTTINARIESIAEKPSFKDAWLKRRCLIPASGYFEWSGNGHHKQPYYICAVDQPILMFAGIWAFNPALALSSYAIVTRGAVAQTAHLHARSPVMLQADQMQIWVNGDVVEAENLARAEFKLQLKSYPVSRAVGNVLNNDARLLDPVAAEADLFNQSL
jgi:putative SOS response-associated peptidase YedK